MPTVVDECEMCRYFERYDELEGKAKWCEHPKFTEDESEHGKAIEREECRSVPRWCPLPEI